MWNRVRQIIRSQFNKKPFLPSRLDRLTQNDGERQAAPTLGNIRDDHIARYEFASSFISAGHSVLDLACGVGYGSHLISLQTSCSHVLAIDLSKEAINYAQQFYQNDKIEYRVGDCLTTPLYDEVFDMVISLETLEHIQEDKELLGRFNKTLKKDGGLILSTPNQLAMPFSSEGFPHHIKHYLPKELGILLLNSGFSIDSVYSQPDNNSKNIIPGWDGVFNIVICKKTKKS